jgi:hypothetical protein
VLVENTHQKQRKGDKMHDKWLGPYKIYKETGKGVYQLKNAAGQILKKSVNVKRLKKYERQCDHSPEEHTINQDHLLLISSITPTQPSSKHNMPTIVN